VLTIWGLVQIWIFHGSKRLRLVIGCFDSLPLVFPYLLAPPDRGGQNAWAEDTSKLFWNLLQEALSETSKRIRER
jgi:hypothetical protein